MRNAFAPRRALRAGVPAIAVLVAYASGAFARTLGPAERDVARQALLPPHQEMAPRIGAALRDQVWQATGAAR